MRNVSIWDSLSDIVSFLFLGKIRNIFIRLSTEKFIQSDKR